MSKLLQNIFKNRNQHILHEFDMSKSGNAMLRHLSGGFPYEETNNVPINPEAPSWQQVNIDNRNCLQKTYGFKSSKSLKYFLNEMIDVASEMQHHPEILINHTQVTVTLYTHDLNDVTERDIELSKKIEEIIEDINVISFQG